MNTENNSNNNKLKFKIVNKNNKATLEKVNNKGEFDWDINVEIKDLHHKNLSLGDWQSRLDTLWISENNLNEDAILMIIKENSEKIEEVKKIKQNFKKEFPNAYRFKYGKNLKNSIKNFNDELTRYLTTIDDVVYNVEADWNDAHNFVNELNIYNTTLKVVDENSTTKSILIEKPIDYNSEDIKSDKNMVWNSEIVKKAKENYSDGLDIKGFDKYLNSISYSSVSNIANKTIEEAFSVKGIINALKNLWEVISTRKIGLLKTTLYGLINSLRNDSENVQNIIRELRNGLDSYKTSPDVELFNDILRSINVDETLNEIDSEINEYKIILDIILRKYSTAQHVARNLFLKEVKEAASFNNRLNEYKQKEDQYNKNDVTEVKFSDNLADYKHVDRFRSSLYNSIEETTKEIKTSQMDDILFDKYFNKVNIEAGTIHDLNELILLLELQFNKDKNNFVNQYRPTDDGNLNNLLSFTYEQLFLIKKARTFNLIYENILFHIRNLINLENELEAISKKADQNWLILFNKWVDFKKTYLIENGITKNKDVYEEDLEINLTKNKKHSIKKREHHEPVINPQTKIINKYEDQNLVKLEKKFSRSGFKIQELVNGIRSELNKYGYEESSDYTKEGKITNSSKKMGKSSGPKPVKLKNKFGKSGQRIQDLIKETKQELKKVEKKK